MKDGHSGFSYGITRDILNKLLDGKPLTPIEDISESWSDGSEDCPLDKDEETGAVIYQCKRLPSLFKTVYPDGTVEVTDVERYICYDIADTPPISYMGGGAGKILDKMFPITFPYVPPTKPYEIYTDCYLTDRKNGDYDTKRYLYITKPEGGYERIDQCFGEIDGKWKEIDFKVFLNRMRLHYKRLAKEQEEKQNESTV